MADNDKIYADQNPAGAVLFVPDAIDTGSPVVVNGQSYPVRRTSMGIRDGANVAFGSTTDVPNGPDSWTTSGLTYTRRFGGLWRDVAKDGTDATGVSQPTGGVGIRGWLSGIFKLLSNALATTVIDGGNVTLGSKADQPAASWTSSASLIATMDGFWRDAAKDGTDITMPSGVTAPTTGSGIRQWLSAGYVQGQQALQSSGLLPAGGNTGQAALTASASLAISARTGVSGTGRSAGSMYCNSKWFYGYTSGVTASTGFVVPAGQGVPIRTTGAVYAGLVSTGNDTLYFDEEF